MAVYFAPDYKGQRLDRALSLVKLMSDQRFEKEMVDKKQAFQKEQFAADMKFQSDQAEIARAFSASQSSKDRSHQSAMNFDNKLFALENMQMQQGFDLDKMLMGSNLRKSEADHALALKKQDPEVVARTRLYGAQADKATADAAITSKWGESLTQSQIHKNLKDDQLAQFNSVVKRLEQAELYANSIVTSNPEEAAAVRASISQARGELIGSPQAGTEALNKSYMSSMASQNLGKIEGLFDTLKQSSQAFNKQEGDASVQDVNLYLSKVKALNNVAEGMSAPAADMTLAEWASTNPDAFDQLNKVKIVVPGWGKDKKLKDLLTSGRMSFTDFMLSADQDTLIQLNSLKEDLEGAGLGLEKAMMESLKLRQNLINVPKSKPVQNVNNSTKASPKTSNVDKTASKFGF